jgi:inward rectifier potassium channel
MTQPSFDPGLSQKVDGRLRRAINKDGSFNVHREGVRWRDQNLFQLLINLSWPRFLLILFAGYVIVNTLFAGTYLLVGVEHLRGAELQSPLIKFLSAFFFSAQTFTTVGYGGIAPQGIAANIVAALEAMAGLMAFAVATGLLFGRFSRPSVRLVFSDRAIVGPYQDKLALMFRIVNGRHNLLMELNASVMLMTMEKADGQYRRVYTALPLEREYIHFLPLSWTVVHPLDEKSPLFGKTLEDLSGRHAEILILVKGFDDTFSQTVHMRYSYRWDEIVWGARFLPVFDVNEHGDLVLHVDRVHKTEPVPLVQISQ